MFAVIWGMWRAIPAWLKVAIVAAGIIGAMWLYIKWEHYLKADLEEQVSELKQDLVLKQAQLTEFSSQLDLEIEKQKQTQEQLMMLNEMYNQHRQAITDLQGKFAKHDLNKLSTKKPGLVEKVINNASEKAIEDLNALGDFK